MIHCYIGNFILVKCKGSTFIVASLVGKSMSNMEIYIDNLEIIAMPYKPRDFRCNIIESDHIELRCREVNVGALLSMSRDLYIYDICIRSERWNIVRGYIDEQHL
jgi:hypothetical protein